jgi:hypothetical protein
MINQISSGENLTDNIENGENDENLEFSHLDQGVRYVCIYVCICVSIFICVCMYFCMYVCMYICMCKYIYIYVSYTLYIYAHVGCLYEML